ncbi:MAG: hypothetical protein ACI92Z_003246 [Paracoccaceae bacterium]|jgi:hypothetical protein
MNLLRKSLTNAVIATAVYVVFGAFISGAGISLTSIKAEFWPSGAMFGVFYGVISVLISRYRQNKS